MARLVAVVVSALLFGCAAVPQAPVAYDDVPAMLASTVQIGVLMRVTHLDSGEVLEESWVGSGVVYGQTPSGNSLILSANHVLETLVQGDVLATELGLMRVDLVSVTLRTQDGRICNLQPLVLGENTHRDVATAVADCDAGPVAPLAPANPEPGDHIYVSGHPLGISLAIVTEGYVSGWLEQYLLVSAAAAPGNSGGPVFYNGQVIGLLVRGSPRYSNISLVAPLSEILARIAQTPDQQ